MDRQFPIAWVLIVLFLTTYLLIGTLLTGEAALPIGVLFLVLILWFSVYRFRYDGLGNRGLLKKMYADLKGTLQGMKQRIGQEEVQRKSAEMAAAEREEQVHVERERRRASSPMRDPVVSRYADMIEKRVREAEARRYQGEGTGRDLFDEEGSG